MGSGPYCAFHRIVCLVDWHRTNAAFIQTQCGFSEQTEYFLKRGFHKLRRNAAYQFRYSIVGTGHARDAADKPTSGQSDTGSGS